MIENPILQGLVAAAAGVPVLDDTAVPLVLAVKAKGEFAG